MYEHSTAGATLVRVIAPARRAVPGHRPDHEDRILREGDRDALDEGDVLAGFAFAELFARPIRRPRSSQSPTER